MALFGLLFNIYPFEITYSKKQKEPSSIKTYKLMHHEAILKCLLENVEKETSKSPLYNVIYNLIRIDSTDRAPLDRQLLDLIDSYKQIVQSVSV